MKTHSIIRFLAITLIALLWYTDPFRRHILLSQVVAATALFATVEVAIRLFNTLAHPPPKTKTFYAFTTIFLFLLAAISTIAFFDANHIYQGFAEVSSSSSIKIDLSRIPWWRVRPHWWISIAMVLFFYERLIHRMKVLNNNLKVK